MARKRLNGEGSVVKRRVKRADGTHYYTIDTLRKSLQATTVPPRKSGMARGEKVPPWQGKILPVCNKNYK